ELRARDAGVELLVAPLVGGRELRRRDVFDFLALELRRPLERNPGLVVVRVDPFELRVAPRRFRRDILRRPRGHCRRREETESRYPSNAHEASSSGSRLGARGSGLETTPSLFPQPLTSDL